jgi:hypothetical protein
MSDSHLDPHLQAEHTAPDRTMPQGTQSTGVEHGHEGRDIIFRPIFLWFGGLSIFMALTLIGLSATMSLWTAPMERQMEPPSPFLGQRQPPPPPRILPNPWDIGLNPMEKVQRYPETLPQEREREATAAAKLGLFDLETEEPRLPDQVVNQVIARYGTVGAGLPPGSSPSGSSAATGLEVPMPSDASGGTSTENRIR